ncbi:50S ribosomal protein L28 [Lactococcus raffinolactis]|jgi:large subunit ribosomal protein L28|nr:50S ribosomal protein L28 [Lactococcus raffinolactis]
MNLTNKKIIEERYIMAKVCYFTGRKTSSANNRSHAMNKTKKQVKPNLQKIKIVENGKVKSVWASARALKNLSVERV